MYTHSMNTSPANMVEDAEAPQGVSLYDPEDFDTHRQLLEDGVIEAITKEWPRSHNGVRIELSDVGYDKKKNYSHKEQFESLKHNRFLHNKLVGTFRLVEEESGDVLDEKKVPLMRVPYMTDRGTYIHGGNEYISIAQARLMPGAYTRRQDNGELETQFNIRPGTGQPFRVAMSPESAQYKLRVRSADMHLYSLLHDMGVTDEELEKRWGETILEKNRDKYDKRVLDRAYERMIPSWERTNNPDRTRQDKAQRLQDAFQNAQVATKVLKRTLPNVFDFQKAAAWNRDGELMQKYAAFSRAELETLASVINSDHPGAVPVDGTKETIKKYILAFLARMEEKDNPLIFLKKSDESAKAEFELDDDGEEYMPVGLSGLLASTEKIKAVSQDVIPPDERDSLRFKKINRTHNLVKERIRMDGPKLRRFLMFQAAKRKNLDGISPYVFDKYITDQLLQNPLSSPLEEINPMQLSEAARRITQMGPGGLGSSQSITNAAQSVHPSQFGFISVLEGPECFDPSTDILTHRGWVPVHALKDDDKVATEDTDGAMVFVRPFKVIREKYSGDLHTIDKKTFSMSVTPSHRCFGWRRYTEDTHNYKAELAANITGQRFWFPVSRCVYAGGTGEYVSERYRLEDLCKLTGWYVALGVFLKKYKTDRPDISFFVRDSAENNEFKNLILRMGIQHEVVKASNDYSYIAITDPYILQEFYSFRVTGEKRIANHWFHEDVQTRTLLLSTIMTLTGQVKNTNVFFRTPCLNLRSDIDFLAMTLGNATTLTVEKIKNPGRKSPSYIVSFCSTEKVGVNPDHIKKEWNRVHYTGMVYCVKVSTGKVIVRRHGKLPIVSGNSERAGIDTRIAWGARIGSNGRLYQKFKDSRTGKMRWMSPEDLDGLTVKLPD